MVQKNNHYMYDQANFLDRTTIIQSPELGTSFMPLFELDYHQSGIVLDIPIALLKGTRSYVTPYPIQNFISYNHLPPIFRAFVTKLS